MKLNLKPILFVVGCLMMTGSYAQKVIIENNKVIVDASALRNSTKVKKARGTDGTATTLGTNDATNIGSEVSDEKVYYKFEVDKEDKGYNFFWLDAVHTCQTLTKDGGGWRVPTKRELLLMYLLKQELEAYSGFAKLESRYWSATEDKAEKSWAVYLYSVYSRGLMNDEPKTHYSNVRCIRDLD